MESPIRIWNLRKIAKCENEIDAVERNNNTWTNFEPEDDLILTIYKESKVSIICHNEKVLALFDFANNRQRMRVYKKDSSLLFLKMLKGTVYKCRVLFKEGEENVSCCSECYTVLQELCCDPDVGEETRTTSPPVINSNQKNLELCLLEPEPNSLSPSLLEPEENFIPLPPPTLEPEREINLLSPLPEPEVNLNFVLHELQPNLTTEEINKTQLADHSFTSVPQLVTNINVQADKENCSITQKERFQDSECSDVSNSPVPLEISLEDISRDSERDMGKISSRCSNSIINSSGKRLRVIHSLFSESTSVTTRFSCTANRSNVIIKELRKRKKKNASHTFTLSEQNDIQILPLGLSEDDIEVLEPSAQSDAITAKGKRGLKRKSRTEASAPVNQSLQKLKKIAGLINNENFRKEILESTISTGSAQQLQFMLTCCILHPQFSEVISRLYDIFSKY